MDIRDQYHDPSFTFLYHILQENPEARAFVKSANLNDEDAADLPDAAFAWPSRRLFPIDTAENTVLSSLYRQKHAAVPADVDTALEKAQSIYGVKDLVEQSKTAAAAPPPEVPLDDYLLPEHLRLRVVDADQVKTAEALLHRDYERLNIVDRATAFTNLVKKARDFDVTLTPRTHRLAGMTVCTTKTAQDWIEARACAVKEPLFKTAYEKLATAFVGRGEVIQDRDQLIKVANALAKMDQQAGLDRRYDKTLPDPIQTVFNTEKLAGTSVDMAGTRVELSKLAAMPKTWWDDVVGPDISPEFAEKTGEELRQVLDTLPLDLKLIIGKQVQ